MGHKRGTPTKGLSLHHNMTLALELHNTALHRIELESIPNGGSDCTNDAPWYNVFVLTILESNLQVF